MKKLNFESLCDIYEDFTHAIREEKIKLSEMTICQVKGYEKKDDKRDVLCILETSVSSLSQHKKRLIVSNTVTAWLMKIGCFFEVKKTNTRFVPTEETIRYCLHDYLKISSEVKLNSFTEDVLSIALKFRAYGKIVFISKRPIGGFCSLIGVKSMKSSRGICDKAINIARELDVMLKDKVDFYTDYTEQKFVTPEFKVMCHIEGHITKNNIPLYILISDNATARKTMTISILAEVNKRYYTLKAIDMYHRVIASPNEIMENIIENVEKYKNIVLNTDVTASDIKKVCIPCIPKKNRAKYEKIMVETKTPLETAHDVLKTDIFNSLKKNHKTLCYDGGKHKYDIALGTLLLPK